MKKLLIVGFTLLSFNTMASSYRFHIEMKRVGYKNKTIFAGTRTKTLSRGIFKCTMSPVKADTTHHGNGTTWYREYVNITCLDVLYPAFKTSYVLSCGSLMRDIKKKRHESLITSIETKTAELSIFGQCNNL